MATNTTTKHLKFLTQPVKLTHRRRYRETTITTSPCSPTPSTAAASNSSSSVAPPLNRIQHHSHKLGNPSVVSPDNTSWSCPNSKPLDHSSSTSTSSPIVAQSTFLSRVTSSMDSPAPNHDSLPSSFSKFNSALTAGLLNPMSPPPAIDKTRSSPTLFEMMVNEPDCHPRAVGMTTTTTTQIPNDVFTVQNMKPVDKQTLMYQRLMDILVCKSPGNLFNDSGSGDVKLTLSSKDGVSISISVHRQILVVHSRFFAEKLSERWAKQQRNMGPYIVEIADCDDIEVYLETLKLMYCKDLKKKLMKEDVSKVLGILKVSTAIGYDAGVLSCLEFLEAAPWAEDEEEKVASLLSELQLEGNGAGEVLKRVSLDASAGVSDKPENEEVLLKLLHVVLEGKDEKARREMKVLVSKMLHESSSHADLRKESLYSACDGCLKLLRRSFLKTADGDLLDASQISRQADNLHWILDILIDRMIAEDFLKTWASLSELSEVHSRVPVIHRYEVSRVTSRLFVAIGKGLLLTSKESRCLLLQTWLVPFYEDFGWMSRATKGLDRHVIEEGLSNTILTLPMAWQQEILMSWFDRFLNSGDDCPNIQRGFEVWWRRAFWKRNVDHERPCQMQIINGTDGN